jgi:hypothetical protein
VTESEWNNGFNAADPLSVGDVISGKINRNSDVDFFVVNPGSRQLLFDIDAQVNGSALDAVICLFDGSKTLLFCNDDSDGLDPLIFNQTWSSDKYYIEVLDYDYPNEGGNDYYYTLAIYNPLLVSAATNGNVAGVAFDKADVLAHYDFADIEKWMLFFNASDLGITQNLVGLGFHDAPGVSFVLQKAQTLYVEGSDQTVTPYDIVQFWPGQYGPSTSGELWWDFRGADYGLTGSSEKIDALAYSWWVSTTGAATFASGVSVRDEDISNLPYGYQEFDGSQVLGLAAENVVGAAVDLSWGRSYYLTIAGSGMIDGHLFTQKDIFQVDSETYEVVCPCPFWNGPAHHFPYNIDAFELTE